MPVSRCLRENLILKARIVVLERLNRELGAAKVAAEGALRLEREETKRRLVEQAQAFVQAKLKLLCERHGVIDLREQGGWRECPFCADEKSLKETGE